MRDYLAPSMVLLLPGLYIVANLRPFILCDPSVMVVDTNLPVCS